jgi:flagella basal body P-ring formation protein FlgA
VTRKVIAGGEALVAPAVAAPPVIIAGDSVDVEHRIGGVRLTTRAVASVSAAQNESLLITLATGARISAIAVSAGKVRLP